MTCRGAVWRDAERRAHSILRTDALLGEIFDHNRGQPNHTFLDEPPGEDLERALVRSYQFTDFFFLLGGYHSRGFVNIAPVVIV